VCKAIPDAVLELSADGHLIAMISTGSVTSVRNCALVVLLGLDLRTSGLPFKLFDSSGGFRVPEDETQAELVPLLNGG
jgi:Uma2 family endonuclease